MRKGWVHVHCMFVTGGSAAHRNAIADILGIATRRRDDITCHASYSFLSLELNVSALSLTSPMLPATPRKNCHSHTSRLMCVAELPTTECVSPDTGTLLAEIQACCTSGTHADMHGRLMHGTARSSLQSSIAKILRSSTPCTMVKDVRPLSGGSAESVGDGATFGVVTVSDRASTGVYEDLSGPAILQFFAEAVQSECARIMWPCLDRATATVLVLGSSGNLLMHV